MQEVTLWIGKFRTASDSDGSGYVANSVIMYDSPSGYPDASGF